MGSANTTDAGCDVLRDGLIEALRALREGDFSVRLGLANCAQLGNAGVRAPLIALLSRDGRKKPSSAMRLSRITSAGMA